MRYEINNHNIYCMYYRLEHHSGFVDSLIKDVQDQDGRHETNVDSD